MCRLDVKRVVHQYSHRDNALWFPRVRHVQIMGTYGQLPSIKSHNLWSRQSILSTYNSGTRLCCTFTCSWEILCNKIKNSCCQAERAQVFLHPIKCNCIREQVEFFLHPIECCEQIRILLHPIECYCVFEQTFKSFLHSSRCYYIYKFEFPISAWRISVLNCICKPKIYSKFIKSNSNQNQMQIKIHDRSIEHAEWLHGRSMIASMLTHLLDNVIHQAFLELVLVELVSLRKVSISIKENNFHFLTKRNVGY